MSEEDNSTEYNSVPSHEEEKGSRIYCKNRTNWITKEYEAKEAGTNIRFVEHRTVCYIFAVSNVKAILG